MAPQPSTAILMPPSAAALLASGAAPGGATCKPPPTPCFCSRPATKPEAFSSSRAPTKDGSSPARCRGMPTACWTVMKLPSKILDPAIFSALATSLSLICASASALPLSNNSIAAAPVLSLKSLACFRWRCNHKSNAAPAMEAIRTPGLSTSAMSAIAEPGCTRYAAGISTYAGVKAICSARSGSAPIKPMSHASSSTASAISAGMS
mmetsp:Transcript_25342/g.78910  ORF Transcript_25342/g.78910 Transcript_25342/m.78910 type:complete len:207 (-) Transcript_25342:383-1003(-)